MSGILRTKMLSPTKSAEPQQEPEKSKSAFKDFITQYAQRHGEASAPNKGRQTLFRGKLPAMRQRLAEAMARVDDLRKKHSLFGGKGPSWLRFGGWAGRKTR